jgi:hypothetical protein
MPQEITVPLPAGSMVLKLHSCQTVFSQFQINGTATTTVGTQIVAVNFTLSMIPYYNTLTATQKTIVKGWEKAKVATSLNEVILKMTNEVGTLTYADIPDDWFV